MSTPNINYSNLDSRYSKPADIAAAISAQATTDAGRYVSKPLFASAYQSVPNSNSTSGSTTTFRATHTLTRAVAGFQLVLPLGFSITSSSTATESVWASSPTVKVAVEIAGATRPVTWWGARVKANDPGGVLISDMIGADLPAGTQIPVRIMIPTSTLYPNAVGVGPGPGATATGDGYAYGVDYADVMTAMGSPVNSNFFCHGIISASSSPKPSVAFIGDSITAGSGDSTWNGGWSAYASNGTVPNFRLAVAGARARGWVGAHTYSWPYLAYCTHAVVLLGTNDLGGDSRTLPQLQGDLTSLYTSLKNRGLKVYGCTLQPRTNSSDSWATTTNQTPMTSAYAAGSLSIRGQLNAWIRAGAGGLLTGYYETADAVESARDSGVWKPNYTADGTHPTLAAHQAIAAAVNLANLVI